MNSFLPWLKKEILEGARSYRFLILGLAAAFFAFLDPLMLKLLPLIMKAQVGADMSSLIPTSRDFAFGTFLGDLFEIQSLIVCLALGGIVAKEKKARVFVMPFTKGAAFPGIILAKAFTYAAYLFLVLIPAIIVSYFYAGLLFPGSPASFAFPLRAALIMSLYFVYLIAIVIFASSIFPSGISASLFSVAMAYGLPALGSLFKVDRFLPSYLALASPKLGELKVFDLLPSSLFALATFVVLLACSATVMGKREI